MFSQKSSIVEVDFLPKNIDFGSVYSINQNQINSFTHGMFKYPCKFIPEIPRWAILKYLSNKNATVLDPFFGSGTTLLETIVNGYNAKGVEIDDVAKLIATVKTTQLTEQEFFELDSIFSEIVKMMKFSKIDYEIPLFDNLEHWFPPQTIEELCKIKMYIQQIQNKKIRDFFKVCFVSIIKRVSFSDDTSPKPYVSNKIKKNPPSVESEFTCIFTKYKSMINSLMKVENLGNVQILDGSATDFLLTSKIDIAITSPPYINAFDYGRTMRLENIWLGFLSEDELRDKKKLYVGTEKIDINTEKNNLEILNKSNLLLTAYENICKKDIKRALVTKRFFEDMEKNLKLVHSYLINNGRYVIVIGNSNIRNFEVKSSEILSEIALKIGFDVDTHFSYVIKNPYIRIPRNGKGGKIKQDFVLSLIKKG